MKIKHVLFFLFLFLVTFFMGFYIRSKTAPTINEVEPKIRETPINTATLPKTIVKNTVTYVAPQNQDFPTEIPIYTVTPKNNDAAAQTVAITLGFNKEKQLLAGTKYPLSLWSGNDATLIAGGDPFYITYSVQTKEPKPITETESSLTSTALSYLNEHNMLTDGYVYKATKSAFFLPSKTNVTVTNDIRQATVAQINFQAYLDEYPVFVTGAQTSSAWVKINGNEIVSTTYVFMYPTVSAKGSMRIISFQEAVTRLISGKGVLTGVQTNTPDDRPEIHNVAPNTVTVQTAVLGYYFTKDAQTLLPVFVFAGNGTLNKETLSTLTIVSALP